MERWIIGLVALVLTTLVTSSTEGEQISLSGTTYTEISAPEYLNPQFNVAGGQTTTGIYTGLVEVLVSGFGQDDFGPNQVDAFYNFNRTTNEVVGLYNKSLRIGSETQLVTLPSGKAWLPNSSLYSEAGAPHVANFAIAYDGDSYVPPLGPDGLDLSYGLVPVYNPDHTYHFVMDLGSYSGTITLGFGDGGTSDNEGAYEVLPV